MDSVFVIGSAAAGYLLPGLHAAIDEPGYELGRMSDLADAAGPGVAVVFGPGVNWRRRLFAAEAGG